MPPTVSVIIPTYNRAEFISQTLDSALAQTFTDYEIIVVDDGSTDNTMQALAGYGDRIRVISLKTNTGPSITRNIALEMAQGEFIAFLDSDDLWYPNALSTLVSYLRENLEIDLVCGAWDVIDESGRTIWPANKPSHLHAIIQTDFLRAMATGNLFLVHALLIRRKCFECCGNFDTTLKAVVDWDLWIRMAMHGHKIDMIDILVARYRRHSGCITRDPQRMELASEQVLNKLFSNKQYADRLTSLRDHAYIQMWLTIAKYYHENGKDTDRRRFVQKAQELYPKAVRDSQLDQQHLSSLLLLPETEGFRRIIVASKPEAVFAYYWSRGGQLLKERQYQLIFQRLRLRNILSFVLGFKDALGKRLK
jgi:glycosyltransferase involved in cell wall biosynthesis